MEAKTDFKALSTKAKIGYVWDYYKWHITVTIILASFIIYLIYHYATYRDPLLRVIMINTNDTYSASTDGFDEFQDTYGYDAKEYPISLTSSFYFPEDENSDAAALSYTDHQSLATMVAAGSVDLFFGTGEVYLSYAEQGALSDLSTFLSPELLEKYKANLLYSTDDGESEPYPCAIELTDNAWLSKYNYYDTCYFGIFYQTQNPDACKEFAEFLLNYE